MDLDSWIREDRVHQVARSHHKHGMVPVRTE